MPKALDQLYQIPATKLWRLLVYNPEPPRDLYAQFEQEPGSLQGMINGLNFVINTWQEPISLEYLIKLHDIAVTGAFVVYNYTEAKSSRIQQCYEPIPQGLRQGYSASFTLTAKTLTQEGTKDLISRIQRCAYFSISEVKTAKELNIPAEGIPIDYDEYYKTILASEHQLNAPRDIELIKARIQHEIDSFLHFILCKEDKLLYIANFIHTLELIHGFADGNCRIYGVLLLIKLLVQYHQSLAFLEDPNILDGHSPFEIKTKIQEGQAILCKLTTQPNLIVNHDPIQLVRKPISRSIDNKYCILL